jgi:hypothetical protein
MKNNAKVTGKTALPGGAKKDASFTKRNTGTEKVTAGRKGDRTGIGPKVAANSGAVVDDGAGTRSRADLPPETKAMKAPEATLPAAALEIRSAVLPLPTTDTALYTVEPYDYARDRKLGTMGSR